MKKLLTVMLVSGVMISLLLSLGPSSRSLMPTALAAPGRAAPMVTAVEPNEAPNDLDITVAISGAGFVETPRVYLGETELTEVTWVSETEVSAVVPWGMDPGVYTLTVENPAGETAMLAGAFTVTQGIGVWTTGGPYGGPVEFLALGDEQGDLVYAIAWMSGLFRSQNGGENWDLIFIETGIDNKVEIDPNNPNRLFVSKTITENNSLYQSINGGDTWTEMPKPLPGTNTNMFLAFVNPHDGVVYGTLRADPSDFSCASGCGVFRFDEIGQTWIRLEEAGLLDETTPVSVLAFDPDSSDIMYVGKIGGEVLMSVDGGQTWSHHSQSPLDYIKTLVINQLNGDLWMCGPGYQAGGTKPGGLFKFDNVGDEWASMYLQEPHTQVRDVIFDSNADDADTQIIWISSDAGVMKSMDGGQSWSDISDFGHGSLAMALNPTLPELIYSNGLDGIAKTTNGGQTWVPVNEGLTAIVPTFMAVNPNQPEAVYGCFTYSFGSQTGGNTWQRLLDTCGHIVVDPTNPQHVIIGTFIADDGVNFNREFTIPMPPERDEPFYHKIIESMVAIARNDTTGLWLMGVGYMDQRLPYLNYDGGGGIYISSDGENWEWTGPLLECPPTGLAIDPVDEKIFYAATPGCKDGQFLKSTDSGQTWDVSVTGLPSDYGDRGLIAVEPRSPNRIFLNGYYVSNDQAATWEILPFPENVWFSSLLVLDGSPQILYAGTGIGLFRSSDGGQTWQRAQGSLGNLQIWSMAGATIDNRQVLYVATVGGVAREEDILQNHRANQDMLVNAGVYRLTTVFPPLFKIYLPLLGN